MSRPPIAQHTVEAPAPPETVWALWSDPVQWPRFYPGLGGVIAPMGLKVGARLELRRADGGGPQAYEVLALEAGRRFTLLRRLPFARLRQLHTVEASPMGCRLHLRMELDGPLAWLYRLTLGRTWRSSLPPLLRALATAAQA